ncbi:MAG TPA: ribosomal protein S18-alanine N-acetyltransferase [Thiolinea sp.]|nr:ribosomal protein S18-alanine N-acetyltransferase [Thiolinea sp.]
MHPDDLDAVMAIELAAYPHPWSRGIFEDCLKHNYHCLVHEKVGEIVAYTVISVAAGEMHVLNLTVRSESRKQGLGKHLLMAAEKIGQALGADECFLEVRPSNTAALQLYRHQGFNEVGLRRNYYPAHKGREHAVIMAKVLAVPEQDSPS